MIAETLFPTIQLTHSKGRIPKFSKTAFIARETNRAAGANSNRINNLDYELIPYELIENDVELSVDYIEEEGAESFMNLEMKIMKDLADIIALGKEKQAADYVQRLGNYDPYALTNCESNKFVEADVNPINIVKDSVERLRKKIGKNPNTAVLGISTYQALMNNPAIIDRVKYSGIRKINTTVLSELFEIPNIKIGYAQHTADGVNFSDV
jgi:hypothetical protein